MRPALLWLAGLSYIEAQNCVDDSTWSSARGNCASYAVGQRNHIYCESDGAVARCPSACQASGCGSVIPQGGACSLLSTTPCAAGLYCKVGVATLMGTCQPKNVVSSTTCNTHSQCGTGFYCFSCFTCQLAVGYANRAAQCGTCFDNPLTPKPTDCGSITTCSVRGDSIDKTCSGVSSGVGTPGTCVGGTTWCNLANACLPYGSPCTSGVLVPTGTGGYSPGTVTGTSPGYQGGITTPTTGGQPPVQGQMDQYGCRNGMGYFWCETQRKCLSYEVTCIGLPPTPNNAQDSYGCFTGAGFGWCAAKNRCIRLWDEPCTIDPNVPGGQVDVYGCVIAQGYSWCASKNRCIQLRVESCDVTVRSADLTVGGRTDSDGCATDAGFTWCQLKNKCLRPFEETCESPQSSGSSASSASVQAPSQSGCPDISYCPLQCAQGFTRDAQGCSQCQCATANAPATGSFSAGYNGNFAVGYNGFGGFPSYASSGFFGTPSTSLRTPFTFSNFGLGMPRPDGSLASPFQSQSFF